MMDEPDLSPYTIPYGVRQGSTTPAGPLWARCGPADIIVGDGRNTPSALLWAGPRWRHQHRLFTSIAITNAILTYTTSHPRTIHKGGDI